MSNIKPLSYVICSYLFLWLFVACSHLEHPVGLYLSNIDKSVSAETAHAMPLNHVIPEIESYKVILVGESHDRYDHHLNQLAVIEGLHSARSSLVIAMEFFQQPFQHILDAYVSGEISEQEMLLQTEYFSRWGYDYRLYAPILRFARKHNIPLLALNIPTEITRQTARAGLNSLNQTQKQQIPQSLDRSNKDYNDRILGVFAMHGTMHGTMKAQNFLDAQLLWDEGMAERAAIYLQENPERKMILLAGAGHIVYRDGIPERLERRLELPVVTLLNASPSDELDIAMADYFIKTQRQQLSSKGILGIQISEDQKGLYVHSIQEQGAAKDAGILPGDRIERLQGRKVESRDDVKLVMWDSEPGDEVSIDTIRGDSKHQSLHYKIILQ